MVEKRQLNVLVTGTPGTGKTSTCSLLAAASGYNHIDVSELIKDKKLHDGWDEHLECFVVNDDLLCDELEDCMMQGGNIVDYHGSDLFPERWFDAVVVLQTSNSVLYDRLINRGYSGAKLENNMQCEIFQVLLEEARDSYSHDIIMILQSDTVEDMNNNVDKICQWIREKTPSSAMDQD